MSGEITLKGKVLAVGGIKEKLLAAHREGIIEAILPASNKPDFKDIPKKVKEEVTVHFVEDMDEVLNIALTKKFPGKSSEGKVDVSPDSSESDEKGESPQKPPVTH